MGQLPFFYISQYNTSQEELTLDEEVSRHIVQVLRMKPGEELNLTNGKGNLIHCAIKEDHKKHCLVKVQDSIHKEQDKRKVTIAISLLKNTSRFEWFLEKATEVGIAEIIPLICDRTEKQKFRYDRMQGICISAMLQSQQCWLPVLREPVKYENVKMWKCENGVNYIAHCVHGEKSSLSNSHISASSHSLICIGPEGDFAPKEIDLALKNKFIPVSLGETRLRSETAGIAAAIILRLS